MNKKLIYGLVLTMFASMLLLFIVPRSGFAANTNLIPTMTSDNAPSGVAFASGESNGNAFNAFDKSIAFNTGWDNGGGYPQYLGYQFSSNTVVNMYGIQPPNWTNSNDYAPKTWTFEGSNDGVAWTVLDTQTNISGWTMGSEKQFSFTNNNAYLKYRINISSAQYSTVYAAIGELYMYNSSTPTPTPTPTATPTATPTVSPSPTPSPIPVPSTGDRITLTVTLTNGTLQEYDLSMTDFNAFTSWYDLKASGTGPARYTLDNSSAKGPYVSKKTSVIFSNILTFSFNEYIPTP